MIDAGPGGRALRTTIESHRVAARADLRTLGTILERFHKKTKGQHPARPDGRAAMSVLRAIALTGDRKVFESAEAMAAALHETPELALDWRAGRDTFGLFYHLLLGSNNPPQHVWREEFLPPLARYAAKALTPPSASTDSGPRILLDSPKILRIVQREYATLFDCLDAVFNEAAGLGASLHPLCDSTMEEEPFFAAAARVGQPSPAKQTAANVLRQLKSGRQRTVSVVGETFSAKREILKEVVQRLDNGYLHCGTRPLPVFALALDAWSPAAFLDRIFRFYAGDVPGTREIGAALDSAAKLAFIRTACTHQPAFIVLADLAPFEPDALMRRLRRDIVGDVLEILLAEDSKARMLLGLNPNGGDTSPTARWRTWAGRVFPVAPSREEFDYAASSASIDLSEEVETADALTMRAALPILRRLRDAPDLLQGELEAKFRSYVAKKDHRAIFDLVWEKVCGSDDRLLLGLIATSHDGLKMSTLVGVLRALKDDMVHRPSNREAVDKISPEPDWLMAWQARMEKFVRWRRDDDAAKDEPERGTFYIRDPVRQLVFEHAAKRPQTLWRDGAWCVAREAARQAKELTLKHGQAAAPEALSRNIQALHSLLLSVDMSKVQSSIDLRAEPASVTETDVLPPLSVPMKRRPDPTASVRHAWSQLYLQEIDFAHSLINAQGDPASRVDSLLPFLRTSRAIPVGLTARHGQSASLESLGPAGICFTPTEQIDLLGRLAVAALAAQSFRLVVDCRRMAETLATSNPGVLGRREIWAVLRAHVDLSILMAGASVEVRAKLRVSNSGAPDAMGLACLALDDVLATLEATQVRLAQLCPGQPDALVDGELLLRRAEVLHLKGEAQAAREALDEACGLERRMLEQQGASASAPLTAGYGVRRLIRHEVDAGLSAPFGTLEFADGLAWPYPSPLSDAAGDRVRRLIDVNERRVIRGARAGRVTVLVDQSRALLARRAFPEAQRQLQSAIRVGGRVSTAHDTLFEIGALSVELSIETGMAAFIAAEQSGRPLSPKDAQEIKDAARNALATFRGLVPVEAAVYTALQLFLAAQLEVLLSRGPLSRAARQKHLLAATERLEDARQAFAPMGVMLWNARLEALASAVKKLR